MTDKDLEAKRFDKTESARKGFGFLNKAQEEVTLRFSGDKEVDKIIKDVYNFIEDKKRTIEEIKK